MKSSVVYHIITWLLFVSISKAQPFESIITTNSIEIPQNFLSGSDDEIKKTGKSIDFGNFNILGIGEQSHGTSEFFKARTSLIKILSERSLVNKIGLEAPMMEVGKLNDYLAGGEVDLKAILKSFRLYSYECEEFIELVEAVRVINEGRKSKIKFFGFDLQSPFGALDNMLVYSVQNKPTVADSLKKLISNYQMLNDQVYNHNFSETDFKELQVLSEYIFSQLMNLDKMSVVLDKSIRSYKQFLQLNDPGITRYENKLLSLVRDSLMAINIRDEVTEKDKMIVFAHNAHLQKNPNVYSKSIGYFLAEWVGKKYKTLGMTTSSGGYTAMNPTAGKIIIDNEVMVPDKNAFEYYFSKTQKPIFFLETAKVLIQTKNIELPSQYRLLPYGITSQQFVNGNALLDFDFIMHLDVTSGNKSFYLN